MLMFIYIFSCWLSSLYADTHPSETENSQFSLSDGTVSFWGGYWKPFAQFCLDWSRPDSFLYRSCRAFVSLCQKCVNTQEQKRNYGTCTKYLCVDCLSKVLGCHTYYWPFPDVWSILWRFVELAIPSSAFEIPTSFSKLLASTISESTQTVLRIASTARICFSFLNHVFHES